MPETVWERTFTQWIPRTWSTPITVAAGRLNFRATPKFALVKSSTVALGNAANASIDPPCVPVKGHNGQQSRHGAAVRPTLI
jgi:hypothetical protein